MPEIGAKSEDVSGELIDPKGKEFPVGRRDFMRLFKVSAMFGATACVQRPVEKPFHMSSNPSIPFLAHPIIMTNLQ